jgi:hypothetical protein
LSPAAAAAAAALGACAVWRCGGADAAPRRRTRAGAKEDEASALKRQARTHSAAHTHTHRAHARANTHVASCALRFLLPRTLSHTSIFRAAQVLQLSTFAEGNAEAEQLLARMHSQARAHAKTLTHGALLSRVLPCALALTRCARIFSAQLVGAAAEAAALARTHREEAEKAQRAAGDGSAGALSLSSSRSLHGAHAPDGAGGASGSGAGGASGSGAGMDDADDTPFDPSAPPSAEGGNDDDNYAERARYIPLRLTLKERTRLRLLEAALSVSDYTDKVDIISYYKSKTQRITKQLQEICAILCGLVVALDYKTGQELLADKDFAQNAAFFQLVFEIGRRHKVMNPDKMRTEYGKLIYLLQDSQLPDVQALLEFKIVTPLKARPQCAHPRGSARQMRPPNRISARARAPSSIPAPSRARRRCILFWRAAAALSCSATP